MENSYTTNGKVYRLNWSGTDFDPKKMGLLHKTVFNSKGQLYCTKCGTFKDVKFFYIRKNGLYDFPCKECRKIKSSSHRQASSSNQRYNALYRAEKKGDERFVELIKSLPDSCFKTKRFSIKQVSLDLVPKHLREFAMLNGVGSHLKSSEKNEPKKRGRKKGQKIGHYNMSGAYKKHKCDENVKYITKKRRDLLSEIEECPVCGARLPLKEFNSEFSYCCKACEKKIRFEPTSCYDAAKYSLKVRDRAEAVEALDKFELVMREMGDAGKRGDTSTFLSLRNEADILRNRLEVSVNWKNGEHVTVYRIPVK